MRLKDKVVIVTGSSGLLGKAHAARLGEEGAKVVLCDVVESEETLDAVRSTGAEAMFLQVDVTSEESTLQMARKAVERFGRIDCLLNNAGLTTRRPGLQPRSILEIDLEAWDRAFAVNVKGDLLCIRAVFPYMRDQGGGKIINTSSGAWLHTSRGPLSTPAYAASKAAVVGLTRSLAKELGRYHICINTLAPSATPQADGSVGGMRREDIPTGDRALGRLATPEDLTGAMVFLLSEDSNFVTGQMLLVNGGLELW